MWGKLAIVRDRHWPEKTDYEAIPRVAILSAAFFVASLIHVPIGPVAEHLVLNGLMGLLLGWLAVPAILIALFLQALLFQFGGLTVLGVNTVTMAAPAVICFYAYRGLLRRTGRPAMVAAFACGVTGILLSGLLVAVALITHRAGFSPGGRNGSGGAYPDDDHRRHHYAVYFPVSEKSPPGNVGGNLCLKNVRFLESFDASGCQGSSDSGSRCFYTTPALAHRVLIFAYAEGDMIHTESKFVPDTPSPG